MIKQKIYLRDSILVQCKERATITLLEISRCKTCIKFNLHTQKGLQEISICSGAFFYIGEQEAFASKVNHNSIVLNILNDKKL